MAQQGQIGGRVDLCQPFILGHARLDARQLRPDSGLFQLLYDGTKPIRRLRMAGAHVVIEIGRMIDETGCTHSRRTPCHVMR